MLLWLGLQVGALALAGLRAPLYAEYPQPGEFHSIAILAMVQWLGVGLLFPILWTNWRGAVWVAASGIVMLMVAGALAAARSDSIFIVTLYFVMFVTSVFTWSEVARTVRAKMILAAVVSGVNLGGILLAYLREDLGGGMGGGGKWKYGALWTVVRDPEKQADFGWILLICVIAVGCLIRLMQWRRSIWRKGRG